MFCHYGWLKKKTVDFLPWVLLIGQRFDDLTCVAGAVSDVEMQEHYDEFFEVSDLLCF